MDYQLELALWTVGSILLSVVGAWWAWRAERQPQGQAGRLRAQLTGDPFSRAFSSLVRFAYYICIPYAASLRHALSPVAIGLLGTEISELPWWMLGWNLADWAWAILQTVGLGALAAVALGLGWWNARRAIKGDLPSGGLLPAPSIFATALESLYAEIHWAFYRAVPLMLIANLYWGTLAGAMLVVVEWVLDPSWRAGLADGSRREALLTRIGWLALSTSIFILTRNVWPIIVLHVTLAWVMGRWVERLAGRTREAPPAESPVSEPPPPQFRKARRL